MSIIFNHRIRPLPVHKRYNFANVQAQQKLAVALKSNINNTRSWSVKTTTIRKAVAVPASKTQLNIRYNNTPKYFHSVYLHSDSSLLPAGSDVLAFLMPPKKKKKEPIKKEEQAKAEEQEQQSADACASVEENAPLTETPIELKEEVPPPEAELAQSAVVSGPYPVCGFAIITLNSKTDINAIASGCAKSVNMLKLKEGSENPPPVVASVGFGTKVWETLTEKRNGQLPENFGHFEQRRALFASIPATGGDLFIHVKGQTQEQCYEFIRSVLRGLPPESVVKIDDQYGFNDGTADNEFFNETKNANDPVQRRRAALLPTGGSYIVHQRWLHKIPDFASNLKRKFKMPRTKDPIYLDWVRRGLEKTLPVVRQSMSFGTLGSTLGRLLVAYSNTVQKLDAFMDNMVDVQGVPEMLFNSYSSCVASNYYYVPSIQELQSLQSN